MRRKNRRNLIEFYIIVIPRHKDDLLGENVKHLHSRTLIETIPDTRHPSPGKLVRDSIAKATRNIKRLRTDEPM